MSLSIKLELRITFCASKNRMRVQDVYSGLKSVLLPRSTAETEAKLYFELSQHTRPK